MSAATAIALTIAGSDSGGGAGIQADLKTFAALGVHGASAITALTAQNSHGVQAIHTAPPGIVRAQIEAVLGDFDVAAIKIGMLASAEIIAALAQALGPWLTPREGKSAPLIVYDPVMVASSGDRLAGPGFVAALKAELAPLIDCLTPNLAEAATLTGAPIAANESEMADQGRALLALGPRAVLMKGGHLPGEEAVDLLVRREGVTRFSAPRRASANLHGTGCVLSSAIAANLALGADLAGAVGLAKDFVGAAIARGEGVRIGSGPGPLAPLPLRASLRPAVDRR